MTTIEQLAGITSQHNEIVKRVGNGSLDPVAVKRALQDIIEGKLPTLTWNPPTWWRTPEQQLERARQLWPSAVLPEPPAAFTPRTKSEVLLLHVPDTFDSLWDKVVAPSGYAKGLDSNISGQNLRLAPNKREFTQPVWLAFDTEHGQGERPDFFWGRSDLAATEVLSALIQFPEWSLTWFDGASNPRLNGYQLKCGDSWLCVPWFGRWGGLSCLKLDSFWSNHGGADWSSPSVREC